MKFLLNLTVTVFGILIYSYWDALNIYVYYFLEIIWYFFIISIGLIAILFIRDRIAYYRFKNNV